VSNAAALKPWRHTWDIYTPKAGDRSEAPHRPRQIGGAEIRRRLPETESVHRYEAFMRQQRDTFLRRAIFDETTFQSLTEKMISDR
jgi:hypothetical protein